MELDTRGCFLLLFKAIQLLSLSENCKDSLSAENI